MTETAEKPPNRPPMLEIDLGCYKPLFDDPGISDEDKMALLEALWSIVISFAQIGWGVHPVQQAQAARKSREIACGQVGEIFDHDPDEASPMVESDIPLLMGPFESAASGQPQGR
jgi:hypothetical protein